MSAQPEQSGLYSPLVSLGMPVYNGESFISEAIDSLVGQTFTDFELIISDNASTDRTAEICRTYADRDPRICFVQNEINLGASANFNKVFHLARGEYFKWASVDDLIGPRFLEKCVEVLDARPDVILAYPRTVIIDEHSREIGVYEDQLDLQAPKAHERYLQFHRRFKTLRECNAVFGLIRAEVLRKTRLIDAFSSSDIVLLSELALLGKYYEISTPMFFRRDHASSSIRANPSPNTRSAWFDPRKPRIDFPRWKIFFEFYRSINRMGVRGLERWRCYLALWEWFRWNGKRLSREVEVYSVEQALRLPSPLLSLLRAIKRRVPGKRPAQQVISSNVILTNLDKEGK